MFLLGVLFVGCKGQKEVVSQRDLAPFIIEDAYVREWLGGAPGTEKGLEFGLQLDQSTALFRLDSVYYAKLAGALEPKGNDSLLYKASLQPFKASDLIMTEDPLLEVINVPLTRLREGTGNSQAIIIYTFRGERSVILIDNVRIEETIAYPESPTPEKQ